MQLFHPSIAARDCRSCLLWFYDEDEGSTTYGKIMKHRGQAIRRKGQKPLCQTHEGCAKGTCKDWPILQVNQMAHAFYRRCKAVNRWPRDGAVARDAALIASEYDAMAISGFYLQRALATRPVM